MQPFAFALALLFAGPHPSQPQTATTSYELVDSAEGCFIDARVFRPQGETQLVIFGSREGYAFYVGRPEWDYKDGAKFHVDVMFYDPDWSAGSFTGQGMTGVVGQAKAGTQFKGYTIPVGAEFIDAIGASKRILISEGGVFRADLRLQGAAPQIARLKSCVASL